MHEAQTAGMRLAGATIAQPALQPARRLRDLRRLPPTESTCIGSAAAGALPLLAAIARSPAACPTPPSLLAAIASPAAVPHGRNDSETQESLQWQGAQEGGRIT